VARSFPESKTCRLLLLADGSGICYHLQAAAIDRKIVLSCERRARVTTPRPTILTTPVTTTHTSGTTAPHTTAGRSRAVGVSHSVTRAVTEDTAVSTAAVGSGHGLTGPCACAVQVTHHPGPGSRRKGRNYGHGYRQVAPSNGNRGPRPVGDGEGNVRHSAASRCAGVGYHLFTLLTPEGRSAQLQKSKAWFDTTESCLEPLTRWSPRATRPARSSLQLSTRHLVARNATAWRQVVRLRGATPPLVPSPDPRASHDVTRPPLPLLCSCRAGSMSIHRAGRRNEKRRVRGRGKKRRARCGG